MSDFATKTGVDAATLAANGLAEADPAASPISAADATPPQDGLARDQERMRLRWQCRRGMLELDLLLNRFLDSGYANLDSRGRANFVRLLGYSDQILQDWLVGQAVPSDPSLCELISAIQRAMCER